MKKMRITVIALVLITILSMSFVITSASEVNSQTLTESQVVTEASTEAPTEIDDSIPHIIKSENTNSGVKLTWSKVNGASKYRVFVKSFGKWKKLGDTKSLSYTFDRPKNNKTYTFTIRCVSSNGKKYTSSYDKAGYKTTYYTAPTLKSATNTETGVKVSWSAVNGINSYRVYVKGGSTSSWKKKADVTSTSYTHTSGTSGSKYTYTVRCLSEENEIVSSFNAKGKSTTYVAAPMVNKIENARTGVKLTWNKVKGASKYRVFVKTNSGWKGVGYTTSTSFVYKNVVNNTDYTFTVRACNNSNKYVSSYIKAGYKTTYYSVPQLDEIKNTIEGVAVSWKAVGGIDSYRLYVKKDNDSEWSKLTDVSGTSYVHTDVESGSKYTYTVKCRKDNSSVSSFNSKGISTEYVATPVIDSATLSNNDVTLKWNAVNGADKYRVFVKSGSEWKKLVDTTNTKYTIRNIAIDKDLTYTVRCCDDDGNYISDFDKAGYTVRVNYIIDQEEHTTEECLYRKTPRSICAKCGADITGKIEDETSEYFGMSKYAYHLEFEGCNSNWRVEYLWYNVNTETKVTDEQLADIANIYLYNENHKEQLEYRYKYSASCKVEGCDLYNKPIIERWSLAPNNALKSEVQLVLDNHKAEHEANGNRVDSTVVTTTQYVFSVEHHPEIGHYELVVK